MEKKKTIKFEARYFKYDMEWVHRAQYNGDRLQEQYFFRYAETAPWSNGSLYIEENRRWSINADRQLMWEVQRFTPIKGIRSKIK
jgi:hypothetical protein